MGAVDFSIDTRLVECLQSVLPISVFVETGTFEGDAIARVLLSFDEIHSIELAPQHYARAVARFGAESKVKLHQGDSAHVLGSLQPALAGVGVLYWLDAHWCAAHETAGQVSQCPVISELAAIGTLNDDSVVLIDDARLFLSAPPDPHEVDDWPRFSAVLEGLLALSAAHEISVINDVIVVFPRTALAAVSEFARRHGTDWLAELQHSAALERERNALLETAAARLAVIDTVAAERDLQTRAASERLVALEEQERKHRRAVEKLQRERDLQAGVAASRLETIGTLKDEQQRHRRAQADAAGGRPDVYEPAATNALIRSVEELSKEPKLQTRVAEERLAAIEELRAALRLQAKATEERLATIKALTAERDLQTKVAQQRLETIAALEVERKLQTASANERLAALNAQKRAAAAELEALRQQRDLQARAAEQRLARIEELAREHSATLEELTRERDVQARAAKDRLATIEELERELDAQRVTAAERLATIEEVARERLLHGDRPPGGWR